MPICSGCGWTGLEEELDNGNCPKCGERVLHAIEIFFWKSLSTMNRADLITSDAQLNRTHARMAQFMLSGSNNVKHILTALYGRIQDNHNFFPQWAVELLGEEAHTSMCVGDIIGIDGVRYINLPGHWRRLTHCELCAKA